MSYQGTSSSRGGEPPTAVRPHRPGQPGEHGPPAFGFRDVVAAMRRHLLMILILFVAVAGSGTAYAVYEYYENPVYKAQAYIRVDPGQSALDTGTIPQTELRIQQPMLLNFIHDQIRAIIGDTAVCENALRPATVDQIISELERDRDERTALSDEALRARAERIVAESHRLLGLGEVDAQATRLREKLLVTNLFQTTLISVELRGHDRQLITDLVNSVVDSYMLSYKDRQTRLRGRRMRGLRQQSNDVTARLTRARSALENFKTDQARSVRLGGERTDLVRRLELLQSARTQAELDFIAISLYKQQLEAQEGAGQITPEMELEIQRDGVLQAYRGAETTLERQKDQLLEKFGEGHDQVRAAESQLQTTRNQIEARQAELQRTLIARQRQQAEMEYSTAEQRLRQISAEYDRAKADAQQQEAANIRYQQLLAEYEAVDEEMQIIRKAMVQAQIADEVSANNVSIRSAAKIPVPGDKAGPQLLFYIPGAFVLGLIVSIGLALMVELIDNRVRTPLEVTRVIQLPVLGTVPDVKEDAQARVASNLALVSLEAPQSLMAESFRQLRTALLYSTDAELKSLLVTSPRASIGKTVVASNLAVTLAQGGARVLLIDSNFRRPLLHRIYDLPNSVGLSSVLARLNSFDEAVQGTSVANLEVLCCGPVPPSPADLLGSEAMQNLLAQARDRYDSIVLDGAPVLVVSDAHVLCSMVDGTALVVSSAETPRGVAIRAKRTLQSLKARVVGAVLNRVRATKGGYFREAYKSYYAYAAREGAAPTQRTETTP